MRWGFVVLVLVGCGPDDRKDKPLDAAVQVDSPDAPDSAPVCPPPPMPAGTEVVLAAPFDQSYRAYDLGVVPGVPNPLGGTAVVANSPNEMLIAGNSENSLGAIYKIGVTRDLCGHIIGWNGTATSIASTPYVDANLVYWNQSLLIYTQWPRYMLSQWQTGMTAPSRDTDLTTVGMTATGDSGPGGLGRVPPGLAGAGELRAVTWPAGRWFHIPTTDDGALRAVGNVVETVTLPNNPGGFAYVPAGSPQFANQAVIVAEWRSGDPTMDRVAVYDVDASGDPVVATRREFFSKFPRPWGAYFEPVTGDYFFLSWGTGADHVYVVQGFVPPPPIL